MIVELIYKDIIVIDCDDLDINYGNDGEIMLYFTYTYNDRKKLNDIDCKINKLTGFNTIITNSRVIVIIAHKKVNINNYDNKITIHVSNIDLPKTNDDVVFKTIFKLSWPYKALVVIGSLSVFLVVITLLLKLIQLL